ncbi:hypothetical protein [Sphaerisporangium flaviroseum]|uniref:hypothetical protein n=1 Tax=Sphaerisporangium flaviroseum TaxID=509199 RepID=UPI0031EB6421
MPLDVPDDRHCEKGLISGMGGKEGLDLSAPQIAGSALAAATAAVAASFLGVTGTVIGAAAASAATTVGNAVYTHYLKRTRDRLKEAHGLITGQREREALEEETAAAHPGEEGLATAVHATIRDHGPADLPPTVTDATPLHPETAETPPLRREGAPRPLWVTLIVATVATFALSMGGILAFELLSGKPLAATVHGQEGSGTSLGGKVDEPAPPTPVPSTPAGDSSPRPKGSASPSQQVQPTPANSEEPAAPSATPAPQSSGDASVAPTADTGTQNPGDGQSGTSGE